VGVLITWYFTGNCSLVNGKEMLAPLHFLFSIEKSNGFTKPGGEALSAGQTAG
jgi:hypothetical protein